MDKSAVVKRQVAINSDWLATLGMAALLAVSLASVVSDVRHITQGEFAKRTSIDTVIVVACFLSLGYSSTARLLRGGLILLGLDASIRVAAFYLHSSGTTYIVITLVARVLNTVGWFLIIAYCVQWFRTVMRIENQRGEG